MQQQIAQLYELQQMDSAIAQHRTWIAGLDDGGKSGRSLAAARGELEGLQQRLRDLEAENRKKELELKSADQERQDKMRKAYGGSVGDAKELGALERKIEELNRRRDKLETEILGLMDEMERTGEQVAKQEKVVAQGQAVHDKIVADYEAARGKLEGEMQQIATRRAELASQIDAAMLKEYEAMRAKLEGVAVAGIDGNMCTACRNVLPQSALTTVKVGKVIVKCQNCRRMLYPSDAW
jgi:predicted  nucleic acid-binding Zn-ribbon protein